MLFQFLAVLLAWTWPIWAFVFVFCLVTAISLSVRENSDGRDKNVTLFTFWAALSLAVILGGTLSLVVL